MSSNFMGETKAANVPEYCQVLRFTDANGQVKEMIFPKGLDLDRPKRPRTTFSEEQLRILETEFQKNQYLVGKERSRLAQTLGLSETQVKIWYQNRRTKTKREKCPGQMVDLRIEIPTKQPKTIDGESQLQISNNVSNEISPTMPNFLLLNSSVSKSSPPKTIMDEFQKKPGSEDLIALYSNLWPGLALPQTYFQPTFQPPKVSFITQ